MTDRKTKQRLGREDWVLAALRALVRGGLQAVKVEPLAREIGATKGSFYWHFRDLSDLHHAMLQLWEALATTAITATVKASGLGGRAQLMLLVDMISIRPGEIYGGDAVEPALRDWGRTDPLAQAAVERVDRQRLEDLQGFLAAAGVPDFERVLKSHLIYAAVIGFENLRLTTGTEMQPALRSLLERLVD